MDKPATIKYANIISLRVHYELGCPKLAAASKAVPVLGVFCRLPRRFRPFGDYSSIRLISLRAPKLFADAQ